MLFDLPLDHIRRTKGVAAVHPLERHLTICKRREASQTAAFFAAVQRNDDHKPEPRLWRSQTSMETFLRCFVDYLSIKVNKFLGKPSTSQIGCFAMRLPRAMVVAQSRFGSDECPFSFLVLTPRQSVVIRIRSSHSGAPIEVLDNN